MLKSARIDQCNTRGRDFSTCFVLQKLEGEQLAATQGHKRREIKQIGNYSRSSDVIKAQVTYAGTRKGSTLPRETTQGSQDDEK